MTDIKFENQSFCFTGKLSELKRSQAEKEVRSRNGFSQKVINRELDYLVIGSIPSTGWKYGNYGNKIEKARMLINQGVNLQLIPENEFMFALETNNPSDSGDIDEKLLICRYSSLFTNGDVDLTALENFLDIIKTIPKTHVSASIEEPFIYKDLYNKFSKQEIDDLLIFQCRIVKHFDLESDTKEFIDSILKGFESVNGINGDLSWHEKKEGSASFAKLLQSIPLRTKLTT